MVSVFVSSSALREAVRRALDTARARSAERRARATDVESVVLWARDARAVVDLPGVKAPEGRPVLSAQETELVLGQLGLLGEYRRLQRRYRRIVALQGAEQVLECAFEHLEPSAEALGVVTCVLHVTASSVKHEAPPFVEAVPHTVARIGDARYAYRRAVRRFIELYRARLSSWRPSSSVVAPSAAAASAAAAPLKERQQRVSVEPAAERVPVAAPAPGKRAKRRAEELARQQREVAERARKETRALLARLRAAKKAGEQKALRQRRRKALRQQLQRRGAVVPDLVQDELHQLRYAVTRALLWGAGVRQGEDALAVVGSVPSEPAALAAFIAERGIGPVVDRIAFRLEDDAPVFEEVVGAMSDGGRDFERRMVAALSSFGIDAVLAERRLDRQHGVDIVASVDGVVVHVQLTTQPFALAMVADAAYAKRRLVNGAWEEGAACSKVVKDLEKHAKAFADVPFVVFGANVQDFGAEQFAADLAALIAQAAAEGRSVIAFAAAPRYVKEVTQ